MDIITNYLTVQEFAQYNPETDMSGYTEATLSGMIDRASRSVDTYLGYTLPLETIADEVQEAVVNTTGSLVIYPLKFPVVSVSSISLMLGTSNVTLNLKDGNNVNRYNLPSRGRSVVYPYAELAFTGALTIRNFYDIRNMDIYTKMTYVAGYSSVPSDIKDAVNLIAKDIFMRQANPQNLSMLVQGGIKMMFKDLIRDDGKSLALQEAQAILNNYRRVF